MFERILVQISLGQVVRDLTLRQVPSCLPSVSDTSVLKETVDLRVAEVARALNDLLNDHCTRMIANLTAHRQDTESPRESATLKQDIPESAVPYELQRVTT